MIRVILYSREGCTLCDQARQDLKTLEPQIPHTLNEINIESDPALLKKYVEKIPVIEIGPYTLKAPISLQELQIALSAASQGSSEIEQSTGWQRAMAILLNRMVFYFARHWLAIINFFVFLYVGIPFSAPIFMKAGANGPANLIHKIYSPMCHQLAYRSWFLFGEQYAYPSEAAGLSLQSYEEATGLDPNDLRAGREFIGNEQLGYKVALCQRDTGIYGGMLLAGLVFGIFRKRARPLPMKIWFLLGILPMALDGGTQLLASFPIAIFARRESSPILRLITGGLFGVMNVWFAFPYLEESMEETRALLAAKLARVKGSKGKPVP